MQHLKWWLDVEPGSELLISAVDSQGGTNEPFVVEARVAGDDGVHAPLHDADLRPGPGRVALGGDSYYDARVWARFAGQGTLQGKAWILKLDGTRHGEVFEFGAEGQQNDTKRAATIAVLMAGPAAGGEEGEGDA